METTVLLLSRNVSLQDTRALILERAGYRVLKAINIDDAVQLSSSCRLAIIGHSFLPDEQQQIINELHFRNPNLFVMGLRFGLIHPAHLLEALRDCLADQSGSMVRVLEPALFDFINPKTSPDCIQGDIPAMKKGEQN